MSEISVVYTLTTPLGTLTFNSETNIDGYWLSDVQGLDGGATRHTEYDLPQRDGSVVLDVLRGAAYPTLVGEIRLLATGSLITRGQLMDNLLAYTDSIRKADGILSWTPSSGPDTREMIVRLAEPVQISGQVLKMFQIQLVAANPFPVDVTEKTLNITSFAGVGGALLFPMIQNSGTGAFPMHFGDMEVGTGGITNGGTTTAWPIITITGPVSSPVVTNLTTGFQVSLPNLVFGGDATLTIDMWNEQVYVGDPSNSYIGYVDFANSDFWGLIPGANSIELSGANSSDAPTFQMKWHWTYV